MLFTLYNVNVSYAIGISYYKIIYMLSGGKEYVGIKCNRNIKKEK